MWKVKNLKIHKLWDEKEYFVEFNLDLNILIGSNGVGKTTILRIINAALNVEIEYLQKLEFGIIKILLVNEYFKQKTLRIEKEGYKIHFYISGKGFVLDDNDENHDFIFSEVDFKERRKLAQNKRKIREKLDTPLIKWLPTSRVTFKESKYFENEYYGGRRSIMENENFIDFSNPLNAKIKALIEEINKKSFDINQLISKEERIFRNNLVNVNFENLNNAFNGTINNESNYAVDEKLKFYDTIRILSNKEELNRVVERIKDLSENFDIVIPKIREIKKQTASLINKILKEDKISIEDVVKVASMSFLLEYIKLFDNYNSKVDHIKEDMKILERNFNQIFEPKFRLDILGGCEFKKYVGNEYRSFNQFDFSSGEKQMLIFLLECALYLKRDCIYLTDEPEISLHLKWQSEYLNTLISSNKNNQYFVATHSPDIVSGYGDKIINLNGLNSYE